MSQVINTNVASLTAQRNLASSQGALQTSLERLSSGLRINSAKDDAAGLAISERFSTQIRGINQAVRNANDGISLAQTAEGALQEINNNLQRVRELAVQARNATNSSSDRAALDAEVQQRISEINRVAQQTQFNNLNLLDGSFTEQVFQVGANFGQTISVDSIASATASALGLEGGTLDSFIVEGTEVTGDALAAGDLTINGQNVVADGDAAAIAAAINGLNPQFGATAENTVENLAFDDVVGTAEVTATATTVEPGAFTTAVADGAETFTVSIDGIELISEDLADTETVTAGDLDTALTAFLAANDGYSVDSGSFAGGDLVLSKADGTDIAVTIDSNTSGTAGAFAGAMTSTNGTEAVAGVAPDYTLSLNGTEVDLTAAASDGTITGAEVATAINALEGFTATFDATDGLTVTADDGSNIALTETGDDASEGLAADITQRGTVSLDSTVALDIDGTAAGLTAAGLTAGEVEATEVAYDAVNVLTEEGADVVLRVVDGALDDINGSRADLGAVQNRFESVIANLSTTTENLQGSRSRILDTDFAAETAALTRAQILQQAGVSVLSQANALPQSVLALLQ